MPAPTAPQAMNGYTTPQPQAWIQYNGITYRETPSISRTTDQQLINILTSAQLANQARRPQATAPRRLHMNRHNLPLSSAPSRSAHETQDYTLPAHPSGSPSLLERIAQTALLVRDHRERRSVPASRPEPVPQVNPVSASPAHHEPLLSGLFSPFPAPSPRQSFHAVPPPPASPPRGPIPPPPAESSPRSERSARSINLSRDFQSRYAQTEDVTPVYYEGEDEECTICQDPFQHGQRVCRVNCRHVFHSACWEAYLGTMSDDWYGCPNCRSAGNLIAVWNYIDPSRTTQSYNGVVVDNLLSGAGGGDTDGSAMRGPGHFVTGPPAFHIQTRLPDGRPSIIVDPGSVGNLCGDRWAKEVAEAARKSGHHPTYDRRPRPLKVSGVGNGTQECNYDCTLPVALMPEGHQHATIGKLTVPAVQTSDLPGLLGLTSLKANRAVLDFNTMKLHFLGPSDYQLEKAMPHGSDTYQLEVSPSGHLVLPICEFKNAVENNEYSLTLVSRSRGNGGGDTNVPTGSSSGSSSSNSRSSQQTPAHTRHIPPPPPYPPVLPDTTRHRQVPPPPNVSL